MCEECYAEKSRITPLLNPEDCLKNHTQYICGSCGRCICIERDPKRNLQRWNFPFKTQEIAKLYLRTADYTAKRACGIYEIRNEKGRVSYKIFTNNEELELYLKKNTGKTCKNMTPVFTRGEYQEYDNTQVRKLTSGEIRRYMDEQTEGIRD
ncbi:hypothetical protein [Aequitasia blattaphilus]|uniref:Uncharacterized protein n=1 Tax=Aequitasia blattaphilus TaxID=2949332 RepID=A0ABT1ECE2_9FIRM|nr:hypothetical protein [Aequitasia blattaphilus]MCP1103505.1 hypothetical protein [Aequitasia blattaphilus]MCR8616145.1 hypothetical protein [Aequitasia blattaphilus]